MAYGNASKKTVPLSALSEKDLEYIAEHINTAYGEKISQLEKDVKNLEDSSGGGEVVKSIFFVHFWQTGPQLSCDKTNEEIIEAIHSGCKIFAMYTNISGSDTVNAQKMISYQTAKGYIDVDSGMTVEEEWVIFKFFDGSDYLKLEYDPKYSTWRESIEHGVFIVPITLNEDGTVTSEISDNDVVEAINSGKIVAADITYKSATIRVYDVVRGDYGVLFSFQAESEIVSVYSDGEYWKSVVDVVADAEEIVYINAEEVNGIITSDMDYNKAREVINEGKTLVVKLISGIMTKLYTLSNVFDGYLEFSNTDYKFIETLTYWHIGTWENVKYQCATVDFVDEKLASITPVKGVDYWTEEDKAEIKTYVDDAILGGAW